MTECTQSSFAFATDSRRTVVADFDGGTITTEAGGLPLHRTEQKTGILRQFAGCFRDYRDPARIEHSVAELLRQRVYGLALGYEDLNDHDHLRADPLLAMLSGKADLEGQQRRRQRDRGKAGAGKSTLNRLELTAADACGNSRYKKIALDTEAVDEVMVDLYIQRQPRQPKQIVLDLDATDDRLHGNQEGRFYHGYYRSYCYLPLYIFIGEHLVCARLRESDQDAAAGSVEEVAPIVALKQRFGPQVSLEAKRPQEEPWPEFRPKRFKNVSQPAMRAVLARWRPPTTLHHRNAARPPPQSPHRSDPVLRRRAW